MKRNSDTDPIAIIRIVIRMILLRFPANLGLDVILLDIQEHNSVIYRFGTVPIYIWSNRIITVYLRKFALVKAQELINTYNPVIIADRGKNE